TGARRVDEVMAALEEKRAVEKILARILDWAIADTGACEGYVVVTTQRERLDVRVGRGPERTVLETSGRSVSKPLVEHALERRETLATSRPFTQLQGKDSVATVDASLLRLPEKITSVIVAPMIARGDCLGVLVLQMMKDAAFGPAHRKSLEPLATLAAHCVKNLRSVAPYKTPEQAACEHELIPGLVGTAPVFQVYAREIARLAKFRGCVKIQGETGTGKEATARALHFQSDRRDGPFVALNVATYSGNLVASELFGHVKGAFTDARSDNQGLLVAAHRGTLFLDEVGQMPRDLQPKLLRVLETGTFLPVGSQVPRTVDVRIVVATNRDLERMVEEGHFLPDLAERLDCLTLSPPPLREHLSDIPLISAKLLAEIARQESKPVLDLSQGAIDALMDYEWPNNVRELRNTLYRAYTKALGTADQIEPWHVEIHRKGPRGDDAPEPEADELARAQALIDETRDVRLAARLMGKHYTTLYRWIRDERIPGLEAS
ncbi:MAG TPA: sigma 54-interacting transcriptional regulator, partial [Planctomycetota bacterium]|nr:sigma 54-interacting transcriptional regulator [Planctomycetota bacterium]